MVVSQVEFSTYDLWVQFHDVPLELFDHAFAVQLGTAVGSLLEVDWSLIRQHCKDYFRVLVRLRLDNPLIPDDLFTQVGRVLVYLAVTSASSSSLSSVESFYLAESHLPASMPMDVDIPATEVVSGVPEEPGSRPPAEFVLPTDDSLHAEVQAAMDTQAWEMESHGLGSALVALECPETFGSMAGAGVAILGLTSQGHLVVWHATATPVQLSPSFQLRAPDFHDDSTEAAEDDVGGNPEKLPPNSLASSSSSRKI
ncbi:hypothetical protein RJ640_008305 [Escallonia rubra]|uniref:DUF4283 domain-containing protein n=1 Tax=Escallonia rubra TaxID=112253 RepID=A0AA88QVB5_9ASTE|nr:hypothetical protein RJ640_008305 [Escallonia rubra]